MPLNATSQDRKVFEPYLCYKFPHLKVRYFESAFVTSSGLVCTSAGLVRECTHYTWKWQYRTCLKEASQYYHDAQDDPQNLITFDDEETYLVVHHPWYKNYYHWLNEAMFRLWMVKDQAKEMILLLPPEDELPKFALNSLNLFTFKSVYHIPSKKSAIVRTLCMPELKPTMASYNPMGVRDLNKMFVGYFSPLSRVNLGERIYISRKKSRRRWIVNEEDVIEVVTQYGFTVVYNEDYSFAEQVSLYSNAKYMISIHGAAMTNMLFMQEGATIFELCKRWTDLNDKHNLIFWYMADALDYKFCYQICEPVNPEEHYFTADIIVDIDLFKKNLELIFPF